MNQHNQIQAPQQLKVYSVFLKATNSYNFKIFLFFVLFLNIKYLFRQNRDKLCQAVKSVVCHKIIFISRYP